MLDVVWLALVLGMYPIRLAILRLAFPILQEAVSPAAKEEDVR